MMISNTNELGINMQKKVLIKIDLLCRYKLKSNQFYKLIQIDKKVGESKLISCINHY